MLDPCWARHARWFVVGCARRGGIVARKDAKTQRGEKRGTATGQRSGFRSGFMDRLSAVGTQGHPTQNGRLEKEAAVRMRVRNFALNQRASEKRRATSSQLMTFQNASMYSGRRF